MTGNGFLGEDMSSNSFLRGVLVAAGLAASLTASGGAASQSVSPCQADLRGSLRSEQIFDNSKDAIFAVEISADAPCAEVDFDLVTTERTSKGEEVTKKTPVRRKVNTGGAQTFEVRYKMARDSDLADWKIALRECNTCGG